MVVVSLAGRQIVKMVPFDLVTSCFNMISNCRSLIMFPKGLEMFRFPVVTPSLRFPNAIIVTVPATSFEMILDDCDRLSRSLYGKNDLMHLMRRVF